MLSTKLYNDFISKYTSNIRYAYDLSKKIYAGKFVFSNISKIEYILNIAKNITEYDESIIISAVLYNPYAEDINLKNHNFSKPIRKISKDLYFLNYINIIQNKSIKPEEIKEYILNTFYKIESVAIVVTETITILDYFDRIDDAAFKKRFLKIVEKSIVPLTYQLGMYNLRDSLLERLVSIKYPRKYKETKKYLLSNFPKSNLEVYKNRLIASLKSNNLKPAAYLYRYKSIGSFYYKVYLSRRVPIDSVADIYAIRLLYDTKKECYAALNFFKKEFKDSLYKITDFIRHPKDNGYRSLHLKVKMDKFPVEIQIRTLEMDSNANYGVAAHFHYKQVPLKSQENKVKNYLKRKNQIPIEEKESGYSDYIFVFTVTNDKIKIPKKSTILDFAFTLHSSFAENFDYAVINDKKIIDKGRRLRNGDKIKIIRKNKSTLKESDIEYIFTKKNKKIFKSTLNKINKDLS